MSSIDTHALLAAIKEVLPQAVLPAALHEPDFSGNEWKYVKDCIDTGWVSSVGSYVDLFEEKLAEFTGVRRAIVVVNGTAALHICLKVVGVERGDEVIIPALTFVATANAVEYCGATPHFVDSSETTLGLDPDKLDRYLSEITTLKEGVCYNKKTGARIKAVVPMHTFGHAMDIDPLIEVCRKFHLELVEDAAESMGSYYNGKHTGGFGKISALSFNGNKIITTGGGGAILTNDEALGKRIKHLTTTARVPHQWTFSHDEVGYNYRMPNINAALGCAQLEMLPKFVAQKRALAKSYQHALQGIQGVSFFVEPNFSKSNYWLNTLVLDVQHASNRDDILSATNAAGIMTRPAWTLMHELPMYRECPRMALDTAESLAKRIINIPSSAKLASTSL